jgi:hypothetical protein
MSSHTETPFAERGAPAGVSRWAAVAILIGWAAVVVLLVYFLEVRPRARTTAIAVQTVATTQAEFPAPPRGAIVYSRQLGDEVLALGIVPGRDEWVVQASVVGPDERGVTGLRVTFDHDGRAATGRPCGAGCYRAALDAASPSARIDVSVEGDASTRWSIALPDQWPPRQADSLVAAAERAWRSLRSLSSEETLSSGPSRVVRSSWRVQAPNRLAYRIADGASAVVIGKRRWDREPGRPWVATGQFPIRQPVPPWVGVTDAHVVGSAEVRGRPAVIVTLFDPNTPSWLRLVLDRETLRTLDLRMVATAHFMHDRFHSFDETPDVRPPRHARP